MNVTYTLNNGQKIATYLWSDYVKNETFRSRTFASPVYYDRDGNECWGEEQEVKVCKDDGDDRGVYIVWNYHRVYLNEFDYMPLEVLIAKIEKGIKENNVWEVRSDDIWATFMKESSRIGIITELPVCTQPVCTQRGPFDISLSDKDISALAVLSEKYWKKDDWHYKVGLEFECEELREYIRGRVYYFCDLCDGIKRGYIKVVVKDKFKEENHEVWMKRLAWEEEQKKLGNRIKSWISEKKNVSGKGKNEDKDGNESDMWGDKVLSFYRVEKEDGEDGKDGKIVCML